MANNTRKKAGPSAGDATGRAKAKLEAEQAQVAAERQNELTMINQAIAAEAVDGIFDPVTGAKVGDDAEAGAEDGHGAEVQSEEELARPIVVDDSPEVMDFGVETVDQGTTVIRVNETLPNVTIGAGNHYNFEEGKQYEVPRHVAAHLEEKGYVWH
jgi:hypothetical protein